MAIREVTKTSTDNRYDNESNLLADRMREYLASHSPRELTTQVARVLREWRAYHKAMKACYFATERATKLGRLFNRNYYVQS